MSFSAMSFNANANVSHVSVMLPTGQHIKGIFCGGLPDGTGVVSLQGWNPFSLPPGYLLTVPMNCIKALPLKAPTVSAPAPKVERSAPTVSAPAPKVERSAPIVAQRAELPAQIGEALERAAITAMVNRFASVSDKAKLASRMEAPVGQYTVQVTCRAYEATMVEGVLLRASIPLALAKGIPVVRKELVEKLGYVPESTYIRFSWEFERDEKGKTTGKDGLVKIFYRWGAQNE